MKYLYVRWLYVDSFVGGDEKGSFESETVKYGYKSQETRTRERLRWRGPAAYIRQTRALVREGAPQKKDRNCQTVINIWSWDPDGAHHEDLLIDWPSVAMWLWIWLRKPVHAAQIVWHWPWTAGGSSSPRSADYRRRNLPVKFRPCDVSQQIRSLKLGKACSIHGIPNECLRHLPRRTLLHVTHVRFNHCFRLCHFQVPWKEAKIIALPKHSKNPTFPEKLSPISLLSTTANLFE
jgi:hypothetical protein